MKWFFFISLKHDYTYLFINLILKVTSILFAFHNLPMLIQLSNYPISSNTNFKVKLLPSFKFDLFHHCWCFILTLFELLAPVRIFSPSLNHSTEGLGWPSTGQDRRSRLPCLWDWMDSFRAGFDCSFHEGGLGSANETFYINKFTFYVKNCIV